MKNFFLNIKKHYKYAVYQAKAELKAEIANSYLSWIWWILDPLFYMLIYTFVVVVVFGNNQPGFPVFVFIGLTAWDLFSRMITGSVKTVKNNIGIINKVYIPKYIFLLSKSFVFIFKFMISFALILILMLVFRVPFTLQMLNFPLIILSIYTVAFGMGTILLHFGVFVEDLANIIGIVMRFLFYFSGIFYDIAIRIPKPYNTILINFNPIAAIIHQFRKAFFYGVFPNYYILLIWFVMGIILTVIGVHLIHKYEDSYAKIA
ncbi:MAG: ABC transporter permease [Clostridia bacterium]|nr:ABC transporter permease [Clostridia bacterium]